MFFFIIFLISFLSHTPSVTAGILIWAYYFLPALYSSFIFFPSIYKGRSRHVTRVCVVFSASVFSYIYFHVQSYICDMSLYESALNASFYSPRLRVPLVRVTDRVMCTVNYIHLCVCGLGRYSCTYIALPCVYICNRAQTGIYTYQLLGLYTQCITVCYLCRIYTHSIYTRKHIIYAV